MDFISIIMSAGKTSVDVALYTLLPIMVVMLIVMKYLEVRGVRRGHLAYRRPQAIDG